MDPIYNSQIEKKKRTIKGKHALEVVVIILVQIIDC